MVLDASEQKERASAEGTIEKYPRHKIKGRGPASLLRIFNISAAQDSRARCVVANFAALWTDAIMYEFTRNLIKDRQANKENMARRRDDMSKPPSHAFNDWLYLIRPDLISSVIWMQIIRQKILPCISFRIFEFISDI